MSVAFLNKEDNEIYNELKNLDKNQRFIGSSDQINKYESFLLKTFNEDEENYYNLFSLSEKIILCGVLSSSNLLLSLFSTITNFQKSKEALIHSLKLNAGNIHFLMACLICLYTKTYDFFTNEINLPELFKEHKEINEIVKHSLTPQIETINKKLIELENKLEQNTKNNAAENGKIMNELQKTINNNKNELNTIIQESNNQIESKINKLNDLLQNNSNKLTNNETNINELNSKLQQNESNISSLEKELIKQIDSKISNLKRSINNNEYSLNQLKSFTNFTQSKDWDYSFSSDIKFENGVIRMKGDKTIWSKKEYEIKENESYTISFDIKQGNSKTKTESLLTFDCFDKNHNEIVERDVKELTTPQKVEKIEYYNNTFYIKDINGWSTGGDKCIAFNYSQDIDVTTQTILPDIEIISIQFDSSLNLYAVKMNRDLSYSYINKYVSLHLNSNSFFGRGFVPTHEFKTFSYTCQGYEKAYSTYKFPIGTKYCKICIRSHLKGNDDEVTLFKNIKLEKG